MTIEDLKTKTLNQVSGMLAVGNISVELAQEYCDLWNAGPHFTTARVSPDGSRITNFETL